MPKAEKAASQPVLQADGPGVFRHKAGLVVKNFVDQPIENWFDGDILPVIGFRDGGLSFRLCVLPSAIHENEYSLKPAFEFRSDTDIRVHAEWSVSIVTPSGEALSTSITMRDIFARENGKYELDRKFHFSTLKDEKFGHYKVIKQNGWLFDGDLHLVADIRFKVLEGGYAESCSAVNPFLSAFRSQLDCPLFPDFTLVSADGVQIKTHKLLLVLQSPVFRAMFENGLEEARTGICKIEDAHAVSIKAMLAFLVGVEPEEWSFNLTKGLFELADKYELTHLLQRSSRELITRLTTKNLPDVLLLALQHSAKGLLNEALEFLEDNLNQAILDGVLVRMASADMLWLQEWRAHAYRRKEGVELKGE